MKTITQKELNKILEEHKLWLDTKGKEGTKADLSNTDLSYANLIFTDLSYSDLSNADLSYANLIFTDLRYANLSNADLNNANLSDAGLSDADLSEADLSDANLSNANLGYANLNDANLRRANLIYSYLGKANLRGVNLSQASTQCIQGLEIYSVDNIGTFEGKVTYIPSLDIVFAGCWEGSLKEFLSKGSVMNRHNKKQKRAIKRIYKFFKLLKTT